MVQTMKRSRKQRIDAAIAYALDRRWDLAATENRALLDEFPDDLETANRLGKALTELGDLEGAAAAYQRSLVLDATNVIARRNLTRIEEMKGSQPKRRAPRRTGRTAGAPASVETVRPHSLIEESGKSAEFDLREPDAQALLRVSAGDPGELVPTPRGIAVRTDGGAVLGYIEPKAGLRLRRLIEGGNRYAAVIRRVGDGEASIYVRETYRDPSLVGQPSFLSPAASARRRLMPRAYTKPSIVRYDADSPDANDDDTEDEGGWSPRSRRREEEDFDGGGFSSGSSSLQGPEEDDLDDVAGDDDEEDESIADDEEEM